MIKLIAVDMDGTLLDSQKRVPEDFLPWVRSHPDIRVAAASGRPALTLYDDLGGPQTPLIVIAENGGVVMEQGQVLHKDTMAPADIRRCLNLARDVPGVYPVLCCPEAAWTVPVAGVAEQQIRTYYRRLTFTADLDRCAETAEVVKIALYVMENRAKEVMLRFADLGPGLKAALSGPDWIDLSNVTATKGAALEQIQRKYGISLEETMGFGDYMNDLEMLEVCGESYAMANACPELMAAAKYITASNDEDGVMRVLRSL